MLPQTLPPPAPSLEKREGVLALFDGFWHKGEMDFLFWQKNFL